MLREVVTRVALSDPLCVPPDQVKDSGTVSVPPPARCRASPAGHATRWMWRRRPWRRGESGLPMDSFSSLTGHACPPELAHPRTFRGRKSRERNNPKKEI